MMRFFLSLFSLLSIWNMLCYVTLRSVMLCYKARPLFTILTCLGRQLTISLCGSVRTVCRDIEHAGSLESMKEA